MPFTPLHMGPALVLKSVVGVSFSLTVFGWSQLVMDIQPLIIMLTKSGHIHGWSHTIGGATLLGLFAAVTCKYLSTIGLSIIRWQRFLPIRWKTAFISSFVGAYSHILIDSIMHVDVSLFYPLSAANPLHGIIGVSSLQKVCIVSAVVGGVLCVVWDFKSNKVQ